MIEKVVFFIKEGSRYVIEKGGKVYKELLNFPSDISSPLTNQNMSKGERHRLKYLIRIRHHLGYSTPNTIRTLFCYDFEVFVQKMRVAKVHVIEVLLSRVLQHIGSNWPICRFWQFAEEPPT